MAFLFPDSLPSAAGAVATLASLVENIRTGEKPYSFLPSFVLRSFGRTHKKTCGELRWLGRNSHPPAGWPANVEREEKKCH